MDIDKARDLGESGGHCDSSSTQEAAAEKADIPSRSCGHGNAAGSPWSDNSLVLELFMDLSSHTLATEEYIIQHKETDAVMIPARLVCTGVDALQPSQEQPV